MVQGLSEVSCVSGVRATTLNHIERKTANEIDSTTWDLRFGALTSA